MNKARIVLIVWMLMLSMMVAAQDDAPEPPPITCDAATDHVMLAQSARDDNDPLTAIAHYTCAIEFAPENATLYGARGLVHTQAGDLVAAVSDYQMYQDLTGTLTPFMQQLIDRVFVTEQAAPVDFAAQSVAPTDAAGHYQRGLGFQRSGQYESAILDFNRAISLEPDNAIYYGARGMAYMAYGLPESAMADFERYQDLTGTLPPFMQQYMVQTATDDIAPIAPQVAPPQVITGDAQSYYERGLFFLRQNNLESAIIDFNVAIGLQPDNPTFYAVRGLAFVAYDEPALAIRDYRRYETLTGTLTPFMQQQIPALEARIAADETSNGQ